MANIFYFSLVDWFWIKQRPQHIAENLSNKFNVTFFNLASWRSDSNTVISHDGKKNKIWRGNFYFNKNLRIIRLRLIPREHIIKFLRKVNKRIIINKILNLDRKEHFDTIFITMPTQLKYIPEYFFKTKKIVYDCMDNYAEFYPDNMKKEINIREKELVSKSHYIISSSKLICDRLMDYNVNDKSRFIIINNGVDINSFDLDKVKMQPKTNLLNMNEKKKIGYIGTVSEWVDLGLIKEAADVYKDFEFYLIGPIDKIINTDEFNSCSNIFFKGAQPYFSIPNILNQLDIAIMPFKRNKLIESVNPVKIYEYLAMGKPVVAIRYTETEKFEGLISLYSDGNEFIKLIGSVSQSGVEKDYKITYARNNNWVNRVEDIIKYLELH